MHKDDQMTPNERLASFFSGKELDRLPAMPFVVTVAGKVCGMTHREKRSSAKNQAGCQIGCYEKYGHDALTVEWGLHGLAMSFGSETNDPEDAVPAVVKYAIDDWDQLDQLDIDNVTRHPWYQLNLEALKICVDKMSGEVGTNISFPGPFTSASDIISINKLLRGIAKHPDKVHQLMSIVTEALKVAAKPFVENGGGIFLCDPIASGNVISPAHYREFVKPYTTDLWNYIHSIGGAGGYHICGDTNAITVDMVETGCDMLSVDHAVNLADAKKLVGSKVPIIGNVDPINTMMLGTTEDVSNEVKLDLRQCYDNPCGYIVSTGCDIPLNGPLENIDAFMNAVRTCAKYPLDPSNFSE